MKKERVRKSPPIPYRNRAFNLIFPSNVRKEVLAAVTSNHSGDFKAETGSPVSIFEFLEKMLGRKLSEKQIEAYKALWGEDGKTWSLKHTEIVLLIGMKGGKNFWAEGDVAYLCYFISCLRDPHAYFSKLTKRSIPYTAEKEFDIVNVSSVGSDQARRAFFDSVKKVLKLVRDPHTGEKWFEKYAKLDFGEKSNNFKKNEIKFPARAPGVGGIRLLSFNSRSVAPEGLHILRYYADELSRADSEATHKRASELLELGLNNTCASFPNGVGKTIGWSYPNETDFDLTAERYELSHKEPQIFGRKYSTWEFNPSMTQEMFADRYKSNPTDAKRVYECEKSISKNNFFQPYSYKLDEMPSEGIKNKISYAIKTTSKTTNKSSSEFTTVDITSILGDNKKRCFTCDPSKVRDRFTILGGYPEIIEPFKMEMFIGDSFEVISTNVKPIVDFGIVIEPLPNKPIDYIAMGDLFTQILRAFPNTQSINSDHYQNEKFRQEIIEKGVNSKTYSFSNATQEQLYTMLRANVWNNNLTLFTDHHKLQFANREMNITEALIFEARTLIKDGKKIDHPVWGSKDIIDSLAILNYDLMNLEVSGVAEDFDLMSDKRISVYVNRYYSLRPEAVQSGISPTNEKEIKEYVKSNMGLTEYQFNALMRHLEGRRNW